MAITANHASGTGTTEGQYLDVSHHTITGYQGTAPVMVAASNATTLEKVQAVASGGSVCDGTNDYVEWQAVLDTGVSPVASSGTFDLGTTGLLFKFDGQMVRGQGRRKTILKTTSAINMVAFSPAAGRGNWEDVTVRGCVLADMTLLGHSAIGYSNGAGANQSCNKGVYGRYAVDFHMENIEICQLVQWGVHFLDLNGHTLSLNNVWIHDCGNSVYAGTNFYSGGLKIGSEWDELKYPFNTVKTHSLVIESCYDGVWVVQTANSVIDGVIEGNYRYGVVCDYEGAPYALAGLFLQVYCEANGGTADIYIHSGNDYYIRIENCLLGSSGVTNAVIVDGSYQSNVRLAFGNNIYANSKTNSLGTSVAWTAG